MESEEKEEWREKRIDVVLVRARGPTHGFS